MRPAKAKTGAAAALAALLLWACTVPKPVPELGAKATIGYRRIAVVEFYNRTQHARAAEELPALLSEKLAEWTVGTDMVLVARSALPELGDPFVEGRIPVGVLVKIRRQHLADAIVIGSVEEFNPYWQPSVTICLKVIDTASAEFPFELSQSWHAGEQQTQEQIADYYRRNRERDDCRFGPDLFATSPGHFLRFVADRVAEQMAATL
ncbi:MAG: hypothetical protein AMK73_00885 [Planctomycetes bacterium SM23_32]|nr:MAG: hypothetical protein AMK73_00885 [Planctomycetes bacterium SM23_32]